MNAGDSVPLQKDVDAKSCVWDAGSSRFAQICVFPYGSACLWASLASPPRRCRLRSGSASPAEQAQHAGDTGTAWGRVGRSGSMRGTLCSVEMSTPHSLGYREPRPGASTSSSIAPGLPRARQCRQPALPIPNPLLRTERTRDEAQHQAVSTHSSFSSDPPSTARRVPGSAVPCAEPRRLFFSQFAFYFPG